MQSLRVQFVCLFILIFKSVSGLPECGEHGEFFKEDFFINSDVLPYQNEFEKIFRNFNENEPEQIEELAQLLKSFDPFITNNLDDLTDVENINRINFVPDRIKAAGYPAESYEVVTDDGYILRLFRIPHGVKSPQTNQTRPPVLLMHGLFDSSNCYVVLGSENSLAYLLADAGYDVWLGNARGTEPSRQHTRFDPEGSTQKEYWNFSWHEIGVHDIKSIIDHILKKTAQKKLSYIGHSQGTTSFLVMTSMRPEYNDKLSDVHLLAPVANLKDTRNQVNAVFARFYTPLKALFNVLGIHKLTVSNSMVSKIFEYACKGSQESTPFTCKLGLAILGSTQINCTSLPDILAYTPAGSSLGQTFHYAQMILNGDFSQFDYRDKKKNQEVYGRDTPPPYNLTKITAPVHLYFSKNDDTAIIENAFKLGNQLPNVKSSYIIPINDFGHVDFTYSRYVKKVLYDNLISKLNKANQMDGRNL